MDRAELLRQSVRYADQMRHGERSAAYFRGEEVDRLPVAISVRETMAPLYGYTQGQYRRDFVVRAFVYQQVSRDFDCLGVSVGPNLKKIGEALGAVATYPENGVDSLSGQPLLDYADLDAYDVPNPERNPVLRALLEDMASYKRRFGDDFPLSTDVGGPLTTAAAIRPLKLLLKDCLSQPEQLRRLLDFSVECVLAWVRAARNHYGVTAVNIADPVASASLIGPKLFRTLAAPALERLIQGILAITGRSPALHICGSTQTIWSDLAQLPLASFRVDNCERLDQLKAVMGGSVCLCGNVPPVEVMLRGDIDRVLAAARDCIIQAADSPRGFILGAGCQLPPGVSWDNLLALLLAARKYGRHARLGFPCQAALANG